jgi:hypothetical protein
MARLEGVARVLRHKRDAAAAYLGKLEAQKGSDASARQATRAMVVVSGQLGVLARLLAATGACDVDALLGGGGGGGGGAVVGEARPLRAKNTIVREALAQLTNVGMR